MKITQEETVKAVAVITIRDASKMRTPQRKAIAKWLRSNADALETTGSEYSDRFTARYFPRKALAKVQKPSV